jgi:hypothetical protein
VARDEHDVCCEVAEQIQRDRPQWLVVWGCYSRRFWAYPLFEMRPRRLVYAGFPDALVDRLDEAERRFRVRPGKREVSEDDTRGGGGG